MSSGAQKRIATAGEKTTVVVTGMDSSGRLYREQVTALIQGADTYCFFTSRQLRVQDSVLIELPADRPGGKVTKIPARVSFALAGPEGRVEIHLRPQGSAGGPQEEAPTSVAHLLISSETTANESQPAAPSDSPTAQEAQTFAHVTAVQQPGGAAAADTVQPGPPLLDAVRTQTADAVLKELRTKLAIDSQTLSIELGRKISKDLSDHASTLGQALAGDLQNQMNQVQVRLDEFHKYLDSVWAGCEAALEESQRARLQAFQEKAGSLTNEAEDRFEKLRIALAGQQLALEQHIQQTVWDSLKQAIGQIEQRADGVSNAAATRAQKQIHDHWGAQEQALTKRAAGVQHRLQSLFDQLESAVERAEAVLDPVRTVADLAEKHHADRTANPQAARGAVALIPVDAGMRRHIQSSIAKARARFRESVGQISQLLESNLGHGNLSATMQGK